MKDIGSDRFETFSAGVTPKGQVSSITQKVLTIYKKLALNWYLRGFCQDEEDGAGKVCRSLYKRLLAAPCWSR